MKNARETIIKILDQVFNNGAYSNILLNSELNKSSFNDKDKALITEIVYGTIKYKYTIDKILYYYLKNNFNKTDSFVLNILRSAIYQMRYLSKIPDFAAVNEAVELTKKKVPAASGLVNAVLRNYLRNVNLKYYDENSSIKKLCFECSFPEDIVKLLINQYGEKLTKKILVGLNSVPSVTVRVNSIKDNFENVFEEMGSAGYDVEEGSMCPEAIKIKKGKNIDNNLLFTKGLITVQDESAMLVAPSLDIKDNLIIFDLCSAPGGKTTHIAELMNNTGKVMAFDIHKNKLPLIENTAKRLGLNNIECRYMDAAVLNRELINQADRVLMDVPCSGIGIIRKKPEIKYTKDLNNIEELIEIQRKILICGARYIKNGGIMIYSTCTLNKMENDNNIKWFISNYPQYSLEKLYFGNSDNIIYHSEGYTTILPNENMDGFFIAKIKRQW